VTEDPRSALFPSSASIEVNVESPGNACLRHFAIASSITGRVLGDRDRHPKRTVGEFAARRTIFRPNLMRHHHLCRKLFDSNALFLIIWNSQEESVRNRLSQLFSASSVVGGVLLLAATAVTGSDILLRWLLGTPLPFAIEFTALSVGLGVLLGFPSRFIDSANVSAQLISEFLPARITRSIKLFSLAISALLIGYIAYVTVLYAAEKLVVSERTPDMALPTGPLWAVVAIVLVLSALGSAIALVNSLREGERE
jgi:TRAP-type C4-dicarboxylate transport system permease small subunit